MYNDTTLTNEQRLDFLVTIFFVILFFHFLLIHRKKHSTLGRDVKYGRAYDNLTRSIRFPFSLHSSSTVLVLLSLVSWLPFIFLNVRPANPNEITRRGCFVPSRETGFDCCIRGHVSGVSFSFDDKKHEETISRASERCINFQKSYQTWNVYIYTHTYEK